MNLMIDPRLTWNITYNARSNKSQPPTSPNIAPATQNESHDWSASNMKRYLQCAEQPQSPSNVTKYCACHAKWISWLIRVTHETSFTMRGASTISLQPHQILRLPRNLYKFKISAETPWIASANRKTIRRHSEDNPNTIRSQNRISHPPLRRPYSSDLEHDFVLKNTTFRAPAISQNVTRCCACHEKSHSNFTKYCACHEKWISWLIRVKYETLFTMRGATTVTLQPQQILRLPRKMNLMFDPRLIWSFISNAQSKQCQPPTSANTAPATKSLSSRLQRKLSELLPPIQRRFEDNPRIIRPWSEDDPRMIRPWNRHLAPAASETLLVRSWRRFCIEKYNISRSGYLP